MSTPWRPLRNWTWTPAWSKSCTTPLSSAARRSLGQTIAPFAPVAASTSRTSPRLPRQAALETESPRVLFVAHDRDGPVAELGMVSKEFRDLRARGTGPDDHDGPEVAAEAAPVRDPRAVPTATDNDEHQGQRRAERDLTWSDDRAAD